MFFTTASADIIPPNTHPLNRCVKVVNLNEFTDIVLIGHYTGPSLENYQTYQIKNNKCLTKGYKFNTLNIYWNTKDKTTSIDPDKLLLENVEIYGGQVEENNPLVKEVIEYSLARNINKKLVLYKSKQISEYNDGTPPKIQTFNNPFTSTEPKKLKSSQPVLKSPSSTAEPFNKKSTAVSPSPESTKTKTFWQTIICFFKKLFGGNCF